MYLLFFMIFFTDNGRLITFGLNKHGQLGVGDFKPRSGVNEVKGSLHGKVVVQAACGDAFTVIATSGMYCILHLNLN